jgi:hypothetical protein
MFDDGEVLCCLGVIATVCWSKLEEWAAEMVGGTAPPPVPTASSEMDRPGRPVVGSPVTPLLSCLKTSFPNIRDGLLDKNRSKPSFSPADDCLGVDDGVVWKGLVTAVVAVVAAVAARPEAFALAVPAPAELALVLPLILTPARASPNDPIIEASAIVLVLLSLVFDL